MIILTILYFWTLNTFAESLNQSTWNLSETLKTNQAIALEDASLSEILLPKLEQQDHDPIETLSWGKLLLEKQRDPKPTALPLSDVGIFLLIGQTAGELTWQIQVITPQQKFCEGLSFTLNGYAIFAGHQGPHRIRQEKDISISSCETSRIQFNHWRAWNTLSVMTPDGSQTTHFLMGTDRPLAGKIQFHFLNGKLGLKVPNFFSTAYIAKNQRQIMVSLVKSNASAPLWSAMVSIPSPNQNKNSDIELERFYKEEGTLLPPEGNYNLQVTYLESDEEKPITVVRQYTMSQVY